jgi:hypothetical protein
MLLAFSPNGSEVAMIRLPFTAAVASIAVASAAPAQPQMQHHWNPHAGWRIIGHKTVSGGTDTDTIYTPGAMRFRQLRLCVFVGPVRMRDFDVYFANGGHQDVQTRELIAPGSCTRAIDLNGRARDISRIRLRYEKIDRGLRRPLIQVSAR